MSRRERASPRRRRESICTGTRWTAVLVPNLHYRLGVDPQVRCPPGGSTSIHAASGPCRPHSPTRTQPGRSRTERAQPVFYIDGRGCHLGNHRMLLQKGCAMRKSHVVAAYARGMSGCKWCTPGAIRTPDQRIRNPLLYPLSYRGTVVKQTLERAFSTRDASNGSGRRRRGLRVSFAPPER